MLGATIEWPGLEALVADLKAVPNLDFLPLMNDWCKILIEGNRRGVLSGKDGSNNPMPPLKYRDGRGRRTRNRRVPDFGTTIAEATGAGPFATGLHDNLSRGEYRGLTGPRLAPRRDQSRVIKNLYDRVDHPTDTVWEAVAAWGGVVSLDGTPFLPFHFDGEGRLPAYDLRPVRPEDVAFCDNALDDFTKQHFLASI